MPLLTYKKKRKFSKTPEPLGKIHMNKKGALKFVVQEHHASHLHYDFRLEMEGVLKSWAVPKGPSMNPEDKRLAVMVEDHPFEYRKFHGTIPKGNYGAGKVYIWDSGTYQSLNGSDRKEDEKILKQGLKKGHITFLLHGKKLKGEFALVQIKKDPKNWLLVKKNDEQAKNKSRITVHADKKYSAHGKYPFPAGATGRKKIPDYIKPMLAHVSETPFDRPGWIFEIKWDGYRAVAMMKSKKVSLVSRNGLDYEKYFPGIIKELSNTKEDMILDGEVVAVDKKGRAKFELLQNYIKTGEGSVVYYVFDILEYNGKNLETLPLEERKKILKKILPKLPHVKYSQHIEKKGKKFFAAAVKNGIEGIMAKDASSRYAEGERSGAWLKIKNFNQQEAVICGITEPRRTRKEFGALVLGVYQKGELIYIGHTGGGFDEKALSDVKSLLKPLFTKKCPFKKEPKTNMPVQWVKPKIVCEVRFANWTDEGSMRQPIFLGIREDKNPREVTKERAGRGRMVKSPPKEASTNSSSEKYTNLEKIYWPKEKYTKGDLIDYYKKIARYIVPYMKDRPQVMNRFPGGISGKNFFQKNALNVPPDIKTAEVFSPSENKYIHYIIGGDEKTLLYLANLGCIEINPWNSRIQHLHKPDYFILDLDPLEISFDKVVETALAAKKVLDKAGAKSFCKTSGATGLHIYVPLQAKYSTDQVRQFGKIIAHLIHAEIPDITSVERAPQKRKRKVYLDYLQNRDGQTLAAPYSVRPRPGAPVSTPLKWSEVKKGLDPKNFTIKTIFKRLHKTGDLWKKVLGKGLNMKRALKKIEKDWKKISETAE